MGLKQRHDFSEQEWKEYKAFWFNREKRNVFNHSAQCDDFFSVLEENMTADLYQHLGCKCWCHFGVEVVQPEMEWDDGERY